MLLNDKVCLITGGASGIGEVTARRFAAEGAIVAIVDIDAEGGRRVADAIADEGGRASAVRADVSSEADVASAAAEILRTYGRIDVLLNNAATILPKPLEEVSEEEWTRVIAINLKSVYLTIKHTIPALRRSKGNIVNMASLNGLVGQKQNAVYASTKGGGHRDDEGAGARLRAGRRPRELPLPRRRHDAAAGAVAPSAAGSRGDDPAARRHASARAPRYVRGDRRRRSLSGLGRRAVHYGRRAARRRRRLARLLTHFLHLGGYP
ncbi:SDR family NAD(P)-dependent oxidoreductase [Cohnella rhizosphaerae]